MSAAFRSEVSLILEGLVKAAVADIGSLFEARASEPYLGAAWGRAREEGKYQRSVGVQVGGGEDEGHVCGTAFARKDPAAEEHGSDTFRMEPGGEGLLREVTPVVELAVDVQLKCDELKLECVTVEQSGPPVKQESLQGIGGRAAVELECSPGRSSANAAPAESHWHTHVDEHRACAAAEGWAEPPDRPLLGGLLCHLPSPRNFVEVSSEPGSANELTASDGSLGEEPRAASAAVELCPSGAAGVSPRSSSPTNGTVPPRTSGSQLCTTSSKLLKLLRPCSVQLVNVQAARTSQPHGRRSQVPRDLRHHQGPHTGTRLCCYTHHGNGVWQMQCSPTRSKSYKCLLCEKSFSCRKLLRRHKRFHMGERPYCCSQCPKTFILRKNLRRHKRFHTGEKPYSCTICGKAFRLKVNLSSHLRGHTGHKPIACDLCNKRFRSHGKLERHRVMHAMAGLLTH